MPGWEMTVTTDTEALVRRAYHLAEGDVLDVQGFIDLFAEDGVFNGIGGVSGQRATGVSNWAMWSSGWATCFPTPAGVIQPTGAKLDIPTADFWYLRNGKVEVFDCHIAFTTLFAQLGILPDYASAVAASAPER